MSEVNQMVALTDGGGSKVELPLLAGSIGPEGAGNRPAISPSRFASTDSGETGYHGPCPPIGRHRYYFHLYALDASLPDLGPTATRREFEAAMKGHVIATAELMGTYAHPGNG